MATAKYHVGDRVVLTASLFMVALSLAILFVFLMFAPPGRWQRFLLRRYNLTPNQ